MRGNASFSPLPIRWRLLKRSPTLHIQSFKPVTFGEYAVRLNGAPWDIVILHKLTLYDYNCKNQSLQPSQRVAHLFRSYENEKD
jgi:hypothetical protein